MSPYLVLNHLRPSATAGVLNFDVDQSTTDVVEVSEMDASQRRSLPNDVLAAPVMPLLPISPLAADEDEDGFIEGPTGKIAWGIEAVGANRSRFTGAGVKVAVVDTGIAASHPAFAGLAIKEKDFVSSNPIPGQAPDQHGHGTHCAGTIFGQETDGIRIGVAPGVSEALIARVFAPGVAATTLQLGAAINWAVTNGADIISMSLGMDFPGYVDQLVRRFGYDIRVATNIALRGYSDNVIFFGQLARFLGSQAAFGKPVALVAASGNESTRSTTPPIVLDAAPPAASEDIVAVGALAQTDAGFEVAKFSNADPACVAPGVNVLSAWHTGGLKALSGTSMATPHVAGVLALHIERLRAENAGNVEAAERAVGDLLAAATETGLPSDWGLSDYGAGLVQAPIEGSIA